MLSGNFYSFEGPSGIGPAFFHDGGGAAGVAHLFRTDLYKVEWPAAIDPVFLNFGDGDGFRIGARARIRRSELGGLSLFLNLDLIEAPPVVESRTGFCTDDETERKS